MTVRVWSQATVVLITGTRRTQIMPMQILLRPSATHAIETNRPPFPEQPEKAGTSKVKPIWILIKQEMMEWQWHQLDHMQIICTSLQTDNYASTSSLNFLQAGCSS